MAVRGGNGGVPLHILRKISPSIYPPNILGTRKEVEALAEFLSKSNTYTRSGTGPPT